MVSSLWYVGWSVLACLLPPQGQIGVDCMARPPKEGEESYAVWKKETNAIHKALAERTRQMVAALNAVRS